jgi:hypothetical protein
MTLRGHFSIELTSVLDRDDLVAEVWFGPDLVAEIRYQSGEARLQVFTSPAGGHWDLPLDEFLAALQEARDKLAPPRLPRSHDESAT